MKRIISLIILSAFVLIACSHKASTPSSYDRALQRSREAFQELER